MYASIAVSAIVFSCRPRAELLHQEAWGRLGVLFVIGPATRLVIGVLTLTADRPSLHLLPIVIGECAVAAAAVRLAMDPDRFRTVGR